jgi:protein O-mannosyl-transferase
MRIAEDSIKSMSHQNRRVIGLITLLVLTAAIFSPLLRCQFLNWDDPVTIQHNPRLFPPTLQGLGENWSQTQGHLYVPVTYTVWWLVAFIIRQPTAAWFHALNILVHLCSVAAVYALLRWRGFRETAALMGSTVFALHPVQVEAVAWCSGTKDLLAAALGLWAIYLAARRRPVIATILFALALFAKPSAVVFPLLAAMLLPRERRTLILVGMWLSLCVPVVWIGRIAQPASVEFFRVPLSVRPAIALDSIAFYVQKLFWPIHLASDYGRSPIEVLTSPAIKLRVEIMLMLAGFLWLFRRQLPCLQLAAGIFIIALLPTLGFVPFDFQNYSTTADHYLYVPMFAAALLVATVAKYRPVIPLLIVLVCILGIRTIYQCRFWADSVTLFSHDLSINPRSQASHVNLAIALADGNDWADADQQYHEALWLNFANSRAQLGVGQILALRGQTHQALGHLKIASRLESDDPLVFYNLAVALASLNRPSEAIAEYEKALAIEPNFAAAQTNLGTLLLERGDLNGASEHYRAALQINPELELPKRGLEEIEKRKAK